MASIALAMKPKWMELILEGRKTVECRRVMPKHLKVGDVVYLYCRGKLHGEVRVRDVEILDGSDDWQMDSIIDTFAEDARLSEDELRDYWEGAKHPGIIILKDARRFDEALEWHGPVVQNFQYMTPVPR